jgi:cytosine/adenosine deaminase-related metal-dependent hydrolase
MSCLIENVTILRGQDFQLIARGYIRVENGVITDVADNAPSTSTQPKLNGKGLLAIPGLIDAHTHIGDAFARDVGDGSNLRELVHPLHGMKNKLLRETPGEQIQAAITQAATTMLASGITTFADFREGGLRGAELLRSRLPATQRVIILGRPNYYFTEETVESDRDFDQETIAETERTLQICDGLGLSGANEYTDNALRTISKLASSKAKPIAIHAAESEDSKNFSLNHFGQTEVQRITGILKPDLLVHLTHATDSDISIIAEKRIPIVSCPRANATLGLGIPPIRQLLEHGVTVALGTDNVMLNEPDMFREMDYASRVIRAAHHDSRAVSAKAVLRMATADAAAALGLGETTGCIEVGKRADIVFLNRDHPNLRFSKNLVASVVHRAGKDNVTCVMVDGQIRHGGIPNA